METLGAGRQVEGFDVTAFLAALSSFFQTYWLSIVVLAVVFWLARDFIKTSNLFGKLWRNLEENIFHNWRLVLLGATGIVLSLASGWTTWDGMKNFTNEPLLSLMITFGIQGVMLIAAWLIGESFATGMNQKAADGGQLRTGLETTMGTAIGVLLFIAVASYAMNFLNVQETISGVQAGVNWSNVANGALILVIAMLALASLLVNRKSDVVTPYLQGSRVVAKNAVLWVMFLACMGTSVFFSFDSLFSNIFPQSERERAATIRTTNQVAGIVADIGRITARRRLAASEQLFQNPAWDAYEQELGKLARLAETAPGAIRAQIQFELEEQNRQLKALQEKRANATSGQAGLAARKVQLTEEISRLNGLRPAAMNETLGPKLKVAAIRRELDERRALTLAEERGVEGSLKIGRGPKFRESQAVEGLIESRMEVALKRLANTEDRLRAIDKRVADGKSELAQIDGELAKLKGEAATADQLIAVAKATSAARDKTTFDPAAGLAQLEREVQAFRQAPSQKVLAQIQTNCGTVHAAMMRVDSLKDRAAAISCDPGQASEAAAPVFALNSGIKAFEANCAGGDALPQGGGTDAMLIFGRKCLQDSGLSSKDSAELGTKLSATELSRDDKAHRFVVTWNAFQDSNSLAFLALAIAISIDALVFMSGLFGANAVRSPLSDVPSFKARSATQLDAIIKNALGDDRYEAAQLALDAMHPITPYDGFTSEVVLAGFNQQQDDCVRKVLNAGATIGAVRRLRKGHYHVRSELFEFLSVVAVKEREANKEFGRLSELERIIGVALMPDVGANAETVLGHLHPINEENGFTSEVFLNEVDPLYVRPVRNVLNAGSTLQVVQRDKNDAVRYYIHADLYKTLARIRARALFQPAGQGRPQLASQAEARPAIPAPPPAPSYGGDLTSAPPALTAAPAPTQVQLPPAPDAEAALADEMLRQRLRDDLTLQIRLAPGAYQSLINSGMLQHAQAIEQALQTLDRRAPELWRHFDYEVDNRRRLLHEAKEKLAGSPQSDAAYLTTLDELSVQIDTLMEPLMLTPGGPYELIVADLVLRMEDQAGKGKLDNREEAILAHLKEHQLALLGNARKAPDDWDKVAMLIGRYDENVSVHEVPSNEQRPN